MTKNEQMLYGIHPIDEATKSGKTFDKVFVQKGLRNEALGSVLRKLREAEVPIQYVPKIKLDRLTGKSHQGIIAFVSPIEFQKLEWLVPAIYEAGEIPFLLVLDGITDVRNFGAICRTAECAGVHAVVISPKGAAPVNADALKTSAGALLRLPVCREADMTEALEFVKLSGIDVVACHENGEHAYSDAKLSGPVALVMGSEDVGISSKILETSTRSIRIPLKGETSSLNVSVAAGIGIFEILRQRGLNA